MNNSEQKPQSFQINNSSSILVNTVTGAKFTRPLEMRWQPKEDITAYELAMCLPYLFRDRRIMPYEIDKSLPHFRHFKITDPNIE